MNWVWVGFQIGFGAFIAIGLSLLVAREAISMWDEYPWLLVAIVLILAIVGLLILDEIKSF